jgi:AAA domain, putative AbiEii toxin, Type IV TA system
LRSHLLVVESIERGARQARFGDTLSSALVGSFHCELARPGLPPIVYEYRQHRDPRKSDESFAKMRPVQWFERCWEQGEGELWKIEDLKLMIPGEAASLFAPGGGLLPLSAKIASRLPAVMEVEQALAGIRLLPSNPRTVAQRREILSRVSGDPYGVSVSEPTSLRVHEMSRWIIHQWQNDESSYRELVEILRTLSLAQDVTVKIYSSRSPEERHPDSLAAVLFDGVNIGFQSDGTIRVVEMVIQLLRKEISCLLMEEPESSVHPGLLGKLLELITSYSLDRQIVITTHSPHVVNWCTPSRLRLVEREGTTTSIHRISDREMELVTQYLQDQGTLADFLYERGSD